MFARLLFESFRRQLLRKALALLAFALGMSICTAMISVATDIGDKLDRELRSSSGANLLITSLEEGLDVNIGGVSLKGADQRAFIQESDLPGMKGIFFGHNILSFAPFLSEVRSFTVNGRIIDAPLTGTYFSQRVRYGQESFDSGVRRMNKFWQVNGEWPSDEGRNVLAGGDLARTANLHVGDSIQFASGKQPVDLIISGIVNSGGPEDKAIVAPLHLVQRVMGYPGAVQKVTVSVLTKPEDAFARQDPRTMSAAELERWSCSPYANSIARQIAEALPGVRVEQIRQVEQNQGKVLSRISGLMMLLTVASLLASTLAISAIMAAAMIQRRHAVGLLKSLGAGNGAVASLFLTEAGLLAIPGGCAGFGIGAFFAHRMGQTIFGSDVAVNPVVLIIVIAVSLLVAFVGSIGAIRKAMKIQPAIVLRGGV